MFHSDTYRKMTRIKNIAISIALPTLLSSCVDTLDVNRTDAVSDAAIWSSVESSDAYITASYQIFSYDTQLAGCDVRFWDCFSDLIKSSSWDLYNAPYNQHLFYGLTSGVNGAGPFECWSAQYDFIRAANMCLINLRRYGSIFTHEEALKREAEIRLCRAYSYFLLARVYGGVPLRTETSGSHGISDGAYETDIPMARASEEDTYGFILDELDFASNHLPDNLSSGWLRGRATKKVALALMSRIALYAERWDIAAKAAEECGKCQGVGLDSDFAHLFTPDGVNSPEVIYAIQYVKNSAERHHLWDSKVSPGGDFALNSKGADARLLPTAELADLYEWKDGTPFDWSTWQSDGHADPFSDREPRFQATILYDGAAWRGRTIESGVDGADGYTEFRRTGAGGGKTCTGYYLRKFLQEDNLRFGDSEDGSWTPDIVIRYAEVLLNQAEAYVMTDLNGNQSKILACINAIRSRVGLTDKTRDDISTVDKAMALIRDERAKELAAEGLRYWDLRRWNLAKATLGGTMMHGVKISYENGAVTYQTVDCDGGSTRIYDERYRYFSIPVGELSNNKLCTNNEGW